MATEKNLEIAFYYYFLTNYSQKDILAIKQKPLEVKSNQKKIDSFSTKIAFFFCIVPQFCEKSYHAFKNG